MVNYNQCYVYKISSKNENIPQCYIGSTTNFRGRKAEHKKATANDKDKNYNTKKYQYIRENGGWDNWTMIELEKYPCNDRRELEARERYWAEQYHNNLLNIKKICITKEEIKEKEKERKNHIICECGLTASINHIARHRKSERHKKNVTNI